ncbi:MAG: polysaccharide biosynthesis C-terminal domain-containing protein, partial [Ruminococcus sp.]|nr:polysaccharide biosynthesis C-terminal domain-containing protein [Ruminococcus sp.]
WVGAEKLDAYWVTMILMTAHLFILTEAIGTQILWSMNEHKEQSILKISIVVVNVFLTIALIQWNPLYGATIGTFISLMLGDIGVMNLIFVKKIKIKLSTYYLGLFKGIIPSMLIAIAAGFGFSFIGLSGWIGLGVNVLVVVAVYLIAMSLFGMNRYEKDLIFGMIKKVFRRPSHKKA